MIEYRWDHLVDWGECDPARIVFYPNVYSWFDRSSHALLKAYGFAQADMIEKYNIAGFPLIETHAEFLSPMKWDRIVSIHSRITSHTSKTFTVNHDIHDVDTLCVRGYEIRFWGVRAEDSDYMLRAMKLPEEFIRCLTQNQLGKSL